MKKIIITFVLTICVVSVLNTGAKQQTQCINPDILGAATDNIADWSNDSKNRSVAIRDETLSLGAIVAFLNQNEYDGGRIAAQVQIIRDEINSPTGP